MADKRKLQGTTSAWLLCDVFLACILCRTSFSYATCIMSGEIDRCLKKVQEGVETFEDIWQKVFGKVTSQKVPTRCYSEHVELTLGQFVPF